MVEVRVAGVDGANDKVCYFVEPNFQLRWIHSVEKQWWEEQYQRIDSSSTEDAELLLTTTYFEALGRAHPQPKRLLRYKNLAIWVIKSMRNCLSLIGWSHGLPKVRLTMVTTRCSFIAGCQTILK